MRLINADNLEDRFEYLSNFANDLTHKVTEAERSKRITYKLAKYETQVQPTIAIESLITGETSDGYHTFNELYHHRAVLFSVICNNHPHLAWKSKQHHNPDDEPMYEGMFVVGINTPTGQATYYHYIDPYWDMFHVQELEHAPEWDGHTPAQAIERIASLAPNGRNQG